MTKYDRNLKKQKLIKALLIANNVATAAKAAGISERTARRWLTEDDVKQDLHTARHEAFQQDLKYLRAALPTAIRTLYEHALSPSTPSGTRVRAAQILLENALAAYRIYELEERLLRIETRVGIATIGEYEP